MGVGLLGFAIVYGGLRLSTPPVEGETIRVAMLQGNIEQGIKNQSRMNARFILDRYHKLQAEAVEAGVDVVVWPEAAMIRRRCRRL